MKKTIYFVVLCVAGILFSCSEDEGIQKQEDVHEKSHNGYKRSIASFEDMRSKLSSTNSQALSLFSNLSNKGGDDYIVAVDSTTVIEISNDSLTTYTLRVYTKDEENYAYSNLVIKETNGETEEYIIHYNPTSEWQAEYDAGNYPDYQGEVRMTDIDGNDAGGNNKTLCTFSIETVVVCTCEGHIQPDTNCSCTTFTNYYFAEMSCSNGNGGGGGSGNGDQPGLPTDPIHGGGGNGNHSYSVFDVGFLNSGGLSNEQIAWLEDNSNISQQIFNYLQENGDPQGTPGTQNQWYGNDEAVQFATELTIFLVQEDGIKDNLRQAIANGITTTAEYTHKIFKKFSQWSSQYPSSITLINSILSGIKYGISDLVDTNPNTCTFADLFNMWLFEFGSNPLDINGLKTTTNQLKNQEGVSQARVQAMIKIQIGDISTPVNHGWTYGQGEFYDGMQNGNFVTAFLGSYTTNITITQISGGYQLNFHVSNPSSWESATRFRIDNNGDGYHDGIFPNTYRNINTDIGLGGNFTQNWYWTEIVN